MQRAWIAVAALLAAAGCAPHIAPSAPPGPSVTVEPSTNLHDGDVVSVTQAGFLSVVVPPGGEITPSLHQCRSGIFPASAEGPLDPEFIEMISALARENCQSFGFFPVGQPTRTVAVDAYFSTASGADVACGATGCAIVVLGVTPGQTAVASAPIAFVDKKK